MIAEEKLRFPCFGGWASVRVGCSSAEQAAEPLERARRSLLDAHRRLSRFERESELNRLNRDPRTEVPASPLMRRFVAAVLTAGFRSGGLVDATMVEEIERAGYVESLEPVEPTPFPVGRGGRRTGPAGPSPNADWLSVGVDEEAGTVIRPPGVQFDSGGIAKGLLADLVGETLCESPSFVVDCCGDMRIGGSAGRERTVQVEDPFGGGAVGQLSLVDGAVATSGITRRSWDGPEDGVAHQLLDPFTGRPAFTGVVQATALARTGLLAEVHAKAALLSGPERAPTWLPFGGVMVLEDGTAHEVPERELLPVEGASA